MASCKEDEGRERVNTYVSFKDVQKIIIVMVQNLREHSTLHQAIKSSTYQ